MRSLPGEGPLLRATPLSYTTGRESGFLERGVLELDRNIQMGLVEAFHP